MTLEIHRELKNTNSVGTKLQVASAISEHARYEVERTRRVNYGEVPDIEERYGVDAYRNRANTAVMRLIRIADSEPELMKLLVADLVGLK